MHLEPGSYVTWFQRSFEMVVTTFSVSTKFFLECVEHDLGQSEFYTAEVITSSTCLISLALSGDSPNTQKLPSETLPARRPSGRDQAGGTGDMASRHIS